MKSVALISIVYTFAVGAAGSASVPTDAKYRLQQDDEKNTKEICRSQVSNSDFAPFSDHGFWFYSTPDGLRAVNGRAERQHTGKWRCVRYPAESTTESSTQTIYRILITPSERRRLPDLGGYMKFIKTLFPMRAMVPGRQYYQTFKYRSGVDCRPIFRPRISWRFESIASRDCKTALMKIPEILKIESINGLDILAYYVEDIGGVVHRRALAYSLKSLESLEIKYPFGTYDEDCKDLYGLYGQRTCVIRIGPPSLRCSLRISDPVQLRLLDAQDFRKKYRDCLLHQAYTRVSP